MKLLKKRIAADGSGSVKLVPEEDDDLWNAYNLIAKDDQVSAVTMRKVQRENSSGGRDAERVRLKLEVLVEATEFDNIASVLRIRGKNLTENDHVKLGAYHTLEIDLQRAFVLTKTIWDNWALELLKNATDPTANADVVAVLIDEGLAHICLVGQNMTTIKARVEASIPRKRGAAIAGYDKALNKFFENVFQALLRSVDFTLIRCIILASPGFTKDQFFDYINLESTRREIRPIIENKSKFILAHSSSAYKHSLKEVLSSPSVASRIKDTKAAQEVRALEQFFNMLSTDPLRATYGPAHVSAAHDRFAVQTLLITDALFRNADIPTRTRYVELVESVKEKGGNVHVFSSMHVSGEQLAQMTGIAAILRYPLPDLEDLEV
ncbi:hypothetical protein SELMODRAFT_81932 [Selaginella moellendorffii]|uniref:Protein pelota homolog n=1 Tax=Selaginella moellendorffii TaxID=88036 RepID=D8QZH2_SELML|nr:protein PELOTA 1 [Selaginella moellendorffii]EFJ34804.1 hypothetical protein SELMODRAFT_81932 [Selaginella moellendorffii]|eukprot:XP_002964471.1 protein PELOTA 1 [Selaginella moellendorffii]